MLRGAHVEQQAQSTNLTQLSYGSSFTHTTAHILENDHDFLVHNLTLSFENHSKNSSYTPLCQNVNSRSVGKKNNTSMAYNH